MSLLPPKETELRWAEAYKTAESDAIKEGYRRVLDEVFIFMNEETKVKILEGIKQKNMSYIGQTLLDYLETEQTRMIQEDAESLYASDTF